MSHQARLYLILRLPASEVVLSPVMQPVQQPDPASTDTKTCSACKIAKPHADYWKRQASLDGLQLACKDCMKQHASQLRHDRRYWQPYNGLMQCCDCEQVKYAKHFAKRIGTVQGAQYECRECNRKRLSEAYQQKKQANPQPTVQTKVCRSCQMQKASSAFHKHVMHKDGLQSHCIGCQVSRRHNFVRSFIL